MDEITDFRAKLLEAIKIPKEFVKKETEMQTIKISNLLVRNRKQMLEVIEVLDILKSFDNNTDPFAYNKSPEMIARLERTKMYIRLQASSKLKWERQERIRFIYRLWKRMEKRGFERDEKYAVQLESTVNIDKKKSLRIKDGITRVSIARFLKIKEIPVIIHVLEKEE